jgi:dTDP-4-amino-4,6-dideoxygalactose transaminase
MASAVEQLERQFAEWLGVQGAVATGYGRGALWLALELLLDGRRGAEVLVPDFVCVQVPEAVRRAGGTPVTFPVERDLTVGAERLEAAITGKTLAIVLVHYYGRTLPGIERLAEVCRRRSVPVIEDCALALGARASDRLAGRFGDLAVFSFSKSDWCHGGGMVATPVRDWLPRLQGLRDTRLQSAARLARCYGLLRRVDWAANRPARSRLAEAGGRWLQRMLSIVEPDLRGSDFYQVGRFDAAMPEFAAGRALHILASLEQEMPQRRIVQTRMAEALAGRNGLLCWRTSADSGDSGAFLLMQTGLPSAGEIREQLSARGITARLAWPAYQKGAVLSENLRWLAEHLVILEVPSHVSHRDMALFAA